MSGQESTCPSRGYDELDRWNDMHDDDVDVCCECRQPCTEWNRDNECIHLECEDERRAAHDEMLRDEREGR